jgi:hypothetical protein
MAINDQGFVCIISMQSFLMGWRIFIVVLGLRPMDDIPGSEKEKERGRQGDGDWDRNVRRHSREETCHARGRKDVRDAGQNCTQARELHHACQRFYERKDSLMKTVPA